MKHPARADSSAVGRSCKAALPIARDRGLVPAQVLSGGEKCTARPKLAGYNLATYQSSDGPRAGLVIGEEVFDAAKLTGNAAYATVGGILADWKAAEDALK